MSFDIFEQLDTNLNPKHVPIDEFAQSNKYCNKSLYPFQRLLLKLIFLEELTDREEVMLDYWIEGGSNNEITISPFIRERTAYLREHGYKHFREIVLVGGRRSSKGFMTGVALSKVMFDIHALQDPGRHFGMDEDKEIYFACLAASQDQAKKYQYADFSSTVNTCVAMQPYIKKIQETEFSVATAIDLRKMDGFKRQGRRVQRDISKLRGVALPANASSIRGSATLALCIDEAAHLMSGDSMQSAGEVYDAAIPALAQFGPRAIVFMNSSPYTKLGKFYERWEQSQAILNGGPDSPTMLGVRFPSWGLFEKWQDDPTYRGARKSITVSPDWDPDQKKEDGNFYFPEEDRQSILIEREQERQDPDKYKVERRGQFAEVIEAYLRPETVEQMFMGAPLPDGNGFIAMENSSRGGDYRFRYKIHLDPSSTTAGFGLCLGHLEYLTIKGREQAHVVIDYIKRYNPKNFSGGVIDWEPILDDLMMLARFYQPYEITMDPFNSDMAVSWLRRALRKEPWGQNTRVYQIVSTASMNWERAELFKTALYMGLIHAPYDHEDCVYASEECKRLQEIKTGKTPRVDHQTVGSIQTKDLFEAIIHVTEGLIAKTMAQQTRADLLEPIRMGAKGGYSIGGDQKIGTRDNTLSDQSGNSLYSSRKGEQAGPGSAYTSNRDVARSRKGGNPARGMRKR